MFTHTFSQLFEMTPVVAYLGPSTVLPIASILAAVAGVVLMFGRYIVATIGKVFHRGQQPSVVTDAAEEKQR